MKNSYTQHEQYYADYLALDKILGAQHLESVAQGYDAHDEMLFIITHQAYELWFKQIIYDLSSVIQIFENQEIDDNSAALQIATHRVKRTIEILKLLVEQVRIMETMTPMDFLDFRNLLTPASGFQSYQFRILEAMLGLKMEKRHQCQYYQQQLREEHLTTIQNVENKPSLLELVDKWLARMPFWDETKYWKDFPIMSGASLEEAAHAHPFWANYRNTYKSNLVGEETQRISMQDFDDLFFNDTNSRTISLSAGACRSALFITLYRENPLLQLPFQLLGGLLEIDELMATWRYRHWIMVRRMIGMRSGTGGSSGAGYLKGALDSHQIFKDLAGLATYLVPRYKLPKLGKTLVEALSF